MNAKQLQPKHDLMYVDSKGVEHKAWAVDYQGSGQATDTKFVITDPATEVKTYGEASTKYYYAHLQLLPTDKYVITVTYAHQRSFTGKADRFKYFDTLEEAIQHFVKILRQKLPKEVATKFQGQLFA